MTRDQIKVIRFAIAHGQSAAGLARHLSISVDEVRWVIVGLYTRYPGLRSRVNRKDQ